MLVWLILSNSACYYSMRNHPLDPSEVGTFNEDRTIDIRATLGIQDSPPGVPGATEPEPDDLSRTTQEYRFSAGDTVLIRIFELLAPGTESPVQAQIDERGEVSIPILGRVGVEGLTPPELESELRDILAQREILLDAQVVVDPLVRRKWTFSLFGAIAAPNLYPLPSPDFRILEALNAAGGLVDGATHIYVFRGPYDPSADASVGAPAPGTLPTEVAVLTPPPAAPTTPPATETRSSQPIDPAGIEAPSSRPIDPAAETTTPARAEGLDPAVDLGIEFPGPLAEEATPVQPPSGERRPADSEPIEAATTSEELSPESPGPGWLFLNQQGWVPDPSQMASPVDEDRAGDRVRFPRDAEPVVDWDRIAGQSPDQRIIELSADALRNGDPRDNIVIRPGDMIRVYAGVPGEYFMMGHVRRPGAYSLTGRQVTLIQAVAAAGGFTPLAWPERCTVYRRIGDRRELKQVNLDHIFAGHEPDVFLKKDDVILVGSHPSAPFLAVLRNAFRVTYGFGFVYDRNFADVDSVGPRTNPETVERFAPTFPGLFQ